MAVELELLLAHSNEPVSCYERQRYYIEGFQRVLGAGFKISPAGDRLFSTLFESKVKGFRRAWRMYNGIAKNKSYQIKEHVGCYHLNRDGKQLKIAIDTADGRQIHDPNAYEWSDVYFKCNKWDTQNYPPKVRPLINGNGTLNLNKINYLESLRGSDKTVDLNYWMRLWIPSNNDRAMDVFEHQVRLFEALAAVDCEKDLLAIIPSEYRDRDIGHYLDRLERAGVPHQYDWGDIGSTALWDRLASSRIVFLRPGDHLCVSWRMNDLLCMGSCVVYDGCPAPTWPQPLEVGKHFFDAQCAIGEEYELPEKEEYQRITTLIESLLAKPELITTAHKETLAYYQSYASPESVAEYIIETSISV